MADALGDALGKKDAEVDVETNARHWETERETRTQRGTYSDASPRETLQEDATGDRRRETGRHEMILACRCGI